MDKFFPAILCILAVVCAGTLSGCTTAVPYAISAAKMVTDGGLAAANHAAPPTTAAQTSANAAESIELKEKQEAQRPYRLVEQKQYDEALPLLRERADKNDAQAQEQIAMLYFEGKGVPEDSTKAAEWMRSNVPGVHIPDDIIRRLEQAERPRLEGRAIAIEMMQQLAEIEGINGIHLMAYKQEEWVGEIVTKSGVLGDRKPHIPVLEER